MGQLSIMTGHCLFTGRYLAPWHIASLISYDTLSICMEAKSLETSLFVAYSISEHIKWIVFIDV